MNDCYSTQIDTDEKQSKKIFIRRFRRLTQILCGQGKDCYSTRMHTDEHGWKAREQNSGQNESPQSKWEQNKAGAAKLKEKFLTERTENTELQAAQVDN